MSKIIFRVIDKDPKFKKKLETNLLKNTAFTIERRLGQAEVILFRWDQREYAKQTFEKEMLSGQAESSPLQTWWITLVHAGWRGSEEIFQFADEFLFENVDPTELKLRISALRLRDHSGSFHDLRGSLSSLTTDLAEDAKILQRFHEIRSTRTFPKMPGVRVRSRYFAGMVGGSDYFDCIPLPEDAGFRLLFTDASSYGIAGKVLALMGRLATKVGLFEPIDAWLQVFLEETAALREKGPRLQIGVFEWRRETGVLEWVGHDPKYAVFINGQSVEINQHRHTSKILPGDKLALLSDGAVEKLGGISGTSYAVIEALKGSVKMGAGLSLFTELGARKSEKAVEVGLTEKEDPETSKDCTLMEVEWLMPAVRKLRS